VNEEIKPTSSWNLPPTVAQTRAIARLAQALGYHEPVEEKLKSRLEARNMIVGFKQELERRKKQ
jgi:hypothetical protein